MDRTHLLIVSFAVSIALLVPSGAWPYEPTGVDQLEGVDDVELAPADGPNGQYAVLNDDGEIEIRISQVNPYADSSGISVGTVRTLPRIFTATNTGSTPVSVWITDDVDALQYVYGEKAVESIEEPANRVTVGPNESVDVGIRIDARDEAAVERADSFVVHASRVETDRVPSGGADPSATPEPTDASTPTRSGETPAPPTATEGDSPTVTSIPDGTNTSTVTPTPTEETVSTPTASVSPPSAATPQPPALDGDRPGPTGVSGVSSTATGALVALLALVVGLHVTLRRAERTS